MSERRRVGIAEIKFGRAPEVLVTHGLGSCLSITLYDPQTRTGAMAHTLLPVPRPGQAGARPGKFVASAIAAMLAELPALGAAPERLQAKLVGGANMFESLALATGELIGERNAQAAREILAQHGVPLAAEDTGGNFGRTAELVLETGEVRVRSLRGPQKSRIL